MKKDAVYDSCKSQVFPQDLAWARKAVLGPEVKVWGEETFCGKE